MIVYTMESMTTTKTTEEEYITCMEKYLSVGEEVCEFENNISTFKCKGEIT